MSDHADGIHWHPSRRTLCQCVDPATCVSVALSSPCVADVVDADSAGRRLVEDLLLECVVGREDVERERLRLRVDVRDGGVNVLVREDRQNRAEDLLLHHRRVDRRVDQRRRDVLLRDVVLTAGHHLTLRGIDQLGQSLRVSLVDDSSEVWAGRRRVGVELLHRLDALLLEGRLQTSRDEHIVGSDARLTGVQAEAELGAAGHG